MDMRNVCRRRCHFLYLKLNYLGLNEGENFVMPRYPSAPLFSGADTFMWKPMRLDGYAVALKRRMNKLCESSYY